MIGRLTDTELINHLDSARHHSYIINELCKRLETDIQINTDTNQQVECPICKCDLYSDFDFGNNTFTIELKK